jgi:hypothetical protein
MINQGLTVFTILKYACACMLDRIWFVQNFDEVQFELLVRWELHLGGMNQNSGCSVSFGIDSTVPNAIKIC